MGVVKTENFWYAVTVMFVYGHDALCEIEEVDARRKVYSLIAPQNEFDELVKDYENGELALADTKAFVYAFNKMNKLQREMREQGQGFWSSGRYATGK